MSNIQKVQLKAQKAAITTPDFANILIVDDQRFDRARLRRMCEQLDFSVSVTEVDALESMNAALGRDTFDLIFLDFHLPDGSGLQALDAIQFQDRNRHAATIMVTGDGQSEIAINAMKNGCSDFLTKDNLSKDSLRRAAINALQKANLNRDLETQEVMRNDVQLVLDRFAKECAGEMKPILVKVMRHVRNLNSARKNPEQFENVVQQISNSCDRLFDFMSDVEDQERKGAALSGVGEHALAPEPISPPPEPDAEQGKIFGRRTSRQP